MWSKYSIAAILMAHPHAEIVLLGR
jgi:hypothetical protein